MAAGAGGEQGRKKDTAGAEDREIEAKYAVPDGETFERLIGLETLGGYRLAPRGAFEITDRYFDTAERDLLRSGHACRRRMRDGGGPEVVTLKSVGGAQGAVHDRSEQEWEIPTGSPPEKWPDGLGGYLLSRLARGRPLIEILTLRQRRTERDVIRGEHRVAVLSLDRVEPGTKGKDPSYELEIELAPAGDESDLRALEPHLRSFGLHEQQRSKFQRALALLDAEGPAAASAPNNEGSGPDTKVAGGTKVAGRRSAAGARKRRMGVLAEDPMAEAGRKILRFHRDQMLAHEAGTIEGTDPEELHDMRVATRRQRAALRIVQPYYKKKTMRPLRDGLRALGGSLGAVRDLDVLSAAAAAYQSKLPAAEARAFQGLLDSWAHIRDGARARMLEHLHGRAYAEFKEHYATFLDAAPAAESAPDEVPRPVRVADVLPREIWSHYGDIRAYGPVLPSASVETLHALRVQGKRLRYLLEYFVEVLDRRVDKAIVAIVALQDHLGQLQDSVVTIRLAGAYVASPGAAAAPGATAAVARYIATRRARIEALRRGLGRPWRGVSGPGFKSSIAAATASL